MPPTELARAALATAFVVAAVAKLHRGGSIRPFLTALGVPGPAARWLAVGVPLAEVLVAVLLVAGAAPWAYHLALAATLGFVAVLLYARTTGVAEACRCYGALDDGRGSRWMPLVRALVLATVAAALAARAQAPAATGFVAGWSLALGALTAAVVLASMSVLDHAWTFTARRTDHSGRSASHFG